MTIDHDWLTQHARKFGVLHPTRQSGQMGFEPT